MSLDHLLGEVQKPARYTGGEWNQTVTTDKRPQCRMALCYPDTYEVGMSHLGSRILYEVANRRPDTVCERAFVPWPDMAALLEEQGEPLATLGTRTPLCDLDIVGITLQHELNYPGIVKLLELGGIPVWAAERDATHPIVIGGGPCAASPEPVAPFFDAFVIGDGEEALGDVIDAYVGHPGPDRSRGDRQDLLRALSAVPGVYVPGLYEPGPSGRPEPINGAPASIRRRLIDNLDGALYPLEPIVPFIEIVHDRAQLEINRGCTHGCRFCQAGMLYRPVRNRSLPTLREQARAILASTGYEQISLSSLSCTDYPHIVELVDAISGEFGEQRVSISLPSLRTDQFGIALAERVSRARKSPVTLAPEAGSQRLRDVINKNVTEANLREAATAAFRAGWHSIKLYFMSGLPTETDDDIRAIAETVRGICDIGRAELGSRRGRLRVAVTVSGFVPKPHSVFETAAQCPREELRRRHELLRDTLREKAVHLKLNPPDQTALEGILARGDRRLAQAIYNVAQSGEGLEAWHEWFCVERWEAALAEVGTTIDTELARVVDVPEEGPWGHIDTGVSAAFRQRERERAQSGQVTPDCREGRCSICGLEDCCPTVGHDAGGRSPMPPAPARSLPRELEGAPPYRAIVTFAKEEGARFLAHLDVNRAIQRAARRAGLPIAYTQGFNQRPRMTIARPLPVGQTGDAELCAIELASEVDPKLLARALHAQMPNGLALKSVSVEPRRTKSPFGAITGAEYRVELADVDGHALERALASVLDSPAIELERETKRGQRTVDIRPGILAAAPAEGHLGLELTLACTDDSLVKPGEVVAAINRFLQQQGAGPAALLRVHRRRLLTDRDAENPSAAGGD